MQRSTQNNLNAGYLNPIYSTILFVSLGLLIRK